jgi:hypothetical protein
MHEMLRIAGEKGFIDTSVETAEFHDTILGRSMLMDIGDPGDSTRPLVSVVKYAPHAEVPVHYHDTDYVSIVLDGEIEVTRKLHRIGDIRMVKKGTAYGPLRAGAAGCTVFEVFANRSGIRATFLGDDELAQRYRALQAEVLERLAVAEGGHG